MNASLNNAVQQLIESATGNAATIVDSTETAGGCISNARIVLLKDGSKFFVKSNSTAPSDMFRAEADGLRAIHNAKAISVPRVIGRGTDDTGTQFLVLEVVDPAAKAGNFYAEFGRQLAEMHKCSAAKFGLDHDNYLGATPQLNTWCGNWCEFWRERRLGFQLNLAVQKGLADSPFNRLGDRLLDRLDDLLLVDEPPSLIHGDLWSGNYMVGGAGQPVLIDPAVYFAHREAEFGMTTLFGGFDQSFYAAYNEAWPLQSGSEERIQIYRLYHLLNHLNLFGTSYLSDCMAIMKKYA